MIWDFKPVQIPFQCNGNTWRRISKSVHQMLFFDLNRLFCKRLPLSTIVVFVSVIVVCARSAVEHWSVLQLSFNWRTVWASDIYRFVLYFPVWPTACESLYIFVFFAARRIKLRSSEIGLSACQPQMSTLMIDQICLLISLFLCGLRKCLAQEMCRAWFCLQKWELRGHQEKKRA